MTNRVSFFWKFTALAALACCSAAGSSSACSSFRVTAKDGTVVSARSMEFGYDVHYALVAMPRGHEFVSPAPDAKTGLKWKNKYGFSGISVFGQDELLSDGMNEAGLAASGLWYETDARWPAVFSKDSSKALAHTMFITWALGNFSTVAEVKASIAKVKPFGLYVPQMKMVPPMHFSLTDATGASIVVEADNGEVHVYDNPLGIMTNAPSFPWMITNLRTYIGLRNTMVAPLRAEGIPLPPTGHGNGMIGLPGDLTPPSRFVRIATTLYFATPAADANAAMHLAMHVLNSVDIVLGMAVDKNAAGEVVSSESTQWVALRDLTNRMFYLRTYEGSNFKVLDLKKIDFSDGKVKHGSLYADKEVITDITSSMQ